MFFFAFFFAEPVNYFFCRLDRKILPYIWELHVAHQFHLFQGYLSFLVHVLDSHSDLISTKKAKKSLARHFPKKNTKVVKKIGVENPMPKDNGSDLQNGTSDLPLCSMCNNCHCKNLSFSNEILIIFFRFSLFFTLRTLRCLVGHWHRPAPPSPLRHRHPLNPQPSICDAAGC